MAWPVFIDRHGGASGEAGASVGGGNGGGAGGMMGVDGVKLG